MARAYTASVSASSSVPFQSKPAPSDRVALSPGRVRYARRKVSTPSGTLTRKIARQPKLEMRIPPSDGPRAVPTADIVPSSPMALPVFAFGTVSPT